MRPAPSLANRPAEAAAGSHADTWRRHARLWSLLTSPLRPAPEDLAVCREAIEEWRVAAGRADPAILVLGVTPELCAMGAPSGGRVIAVDKSADMIRAVWPGPRHARDAVIRADWRAAPIAPASVDIVLADGSLCPLAYPDDHDALCAELRRVLRPGGRWILRCFANLEEREPVEDVLADLGRGAIGNFCVLKWRLMMALHADARKGVTPSRAWDALHAAWPDLELLAARQGWPIEHVRGLEAYRGNKTRYTYPTLAQHLASLWRGGFDLVRMSTPHYELGERCPTLVLALHAGGQRRR